jgi:hypothetical protein
MPGGTKPWFLPVSHLRSGRSHLVADIAATLINPPVARPHVGQI